MKQDFRKLVVWVEETLKTTVAEERKLLELTPLHESQEQRSDSFEASAKAR